MMTEEEWEEEVPEFLFNNPLCSGIEIKVMS